MRAHDLTLKVEKQSRFSARGGLSHDTAVARWPVLISDEAR